MKPLLFVLLFLTVITIQAQKVISEGTLTYSISIEPLDKAKSTNGLSNATTSIVLKGMFSRTEMSSALGNETTIYNGKTGNAVILKEYSGQKLMITLTKENWADRNKAYNNLKFQEGNETKLIEGYNCRMATGKLADGTTITVQYSPDYIFINKDHNQMFSNISGLPVLYEVETMKMKFIYKLTGLDYTPIPILRFDFPKSGYRTITYSENKTVRGE